MNERTFWTYVSKTPGCWIWGGQQHKGYGRYGGRQAHRISYELLRSRIPVGLELDHVCLNTLCVNPDHLEPVTRAENMRRRAALITRCPKGHPYDEANTYSRITRRGHHQRNCRACNRAASLRRIRRVRSVAS